MPYLNEWSKGFYVVLNIFGHIATVIETRNLEEIPFSS